MTAADDGARVLRRCGDRALLVDLPTLDDVMALHRALADDPPAGVTDLVPAARTLLVRVERPDALAGVAAAVRDRPAVPRSTTDPRDDEPLTLRVRYDGEDLDAVADLLDRSREAIVAAHTGQTWTVAFTGFAPGFGYLVGEDDTLVVPRRDESRVRVPAGAVGLAGEFSGVYPRESPGGWQLIGSTATTMWDPDRDPPALLVPGRRVRFEEER